MDSLAESQISCFKDENKAPQISEEEIARNKRQETLNKDPDYVRTMAMINETQRKNQNTLDTLGQTLKNLNSTLADVQKTFHTYDTFKTEFGKVMASFADKFESLAAPVHARIPKEGDYENAPRVSSIKDVVQEIKTKGHIVILTGAGQSVASNIPTFRGEGGYWTLRNENEKISASSFLTHKYFYKSPEEIWRWHHVFRRLVEKNRPNISHHALADLQIFYKKQKKKFTLITQNIDGYHVDAYAQALAKSQQVKQNSSTKSTAKSNSSISSIKSTSVKSTPKNLSGKSPTTSATLKKTEEKKTSEEVKQGTPAITKKFGFCEEVYELHGSINYMRCDKSCTTDLFPGPKVGCDDDFVPTCPRCMGVARPHTLFFDESYEQEYYRKDTILNEIQTGDCLIVIGTALETNLAATIVAQAITNKKLIIEINPQPCIKNGNVRHLIGGVEKVLPDLAKALQIK